MPKNAERMDPLEFIGRVTSHISDKSQATIRYFGPYVNAYRGKMKKERLAPLILRIVEEEEKRILSKGWAKMILRFRSSALSTVLNEAAI